MNKTNNEVASTNLKQCNRVLICQGRSCKSLGSAEIFKAFKNYSPTDLDIIGSGCLGQCGNGPMVLVLPQEYWYNRVSKSNVRALVENQ